MPHPAGIYLLKVKNGISISNIYDGAFLQEQLTAFNILIFPRKSSVVNTHRKCPTQPAFTCLKLRMESQAQGVRYVQS